MSGRSAGLIAELRAHIASFETAKRECSARMISLGAVSIEDALPMGGLRRDALHEVAAATYGDMAAAMGFATALITRFAEASPMAPILWCEGSHAPFDVGGLYGPGLAAFGLDPARLIIVTPPRDVELLWTLEEALRLGAFAMVVGEIDAGSRAFDLTATRRLQLAAEDGGASALLLTGHQSGGSSAAATRWRIAAAPGSPGLRLEGHSMELVGRPRWKATLERCRGAEGGGTWLVEWDVAQRKFSTLDRDPREAARRKEGILELAG